MVTIDDLPISDFYKSFYRENGYTFTDYQMATIIYFSSYTADFSYDEKIRLLTCIMEETEDEALQAQILERLKYDRLCYEKFKDRTGKNSIYMVYQYDDESGKEYFTEFGKALSWGMTYCEMDHVPIDLIQLNPADDECDLEWFHGKADFTKEGKLRESVCYSEIGFVSPEDTHGKPYRFEEAYLDIQYPFDRGDIVADCNDALNMGNIGMVSTSKKQWEERNERFRSWIVDQKFPARIDYYDVLAAVHYIDCDKGTFIYGSRNPLRLIPVTEDMVANKAYWDLLKWMSDIEKGEGTLSDIYHYWEQYKKSL